MLPSETIIPGVLFNTPSVEPSVSAVFSTLKTNRSGLRVMVGFLAITVTSFKLSEISFS